MKHINIFKTVGKQLFFVFFITLLYGTVALGQQDVTIKGTVISDADGMGLPGVSVVVKGTTRGMVTDMNGAYTITVPSNAVLIFSFVGHTTQEISVEGRSIVDVTLNEGSTVLEEVVITALGITRQEKSLGYSVGKVSSQELVRVPQENVLNALAGKVSGVTINQTGGTGSSVSMVIRGATSLFNDNQPLFVIDGVPVSNTLNNVSSFGSDNRVDYGNAISDLNAEDIENMTILKGPSAAALYGSRAGNGVVVITTKSGKGAKGFRVDVSSNTVFDVPYKFYQKQQLFASGARPQTPNDVPEGSILNVGWTASTDFFGSGIPLDKGIYAVQWHSPLDGNDNRIPIEVVGHPNNMKNFVNTGITTTNSVSVSNGNEWMNYRVGITNMLNEGIIPGSDLNRNNISAAAQLKAAKNFTISTNINYSQNWGNRPAGNRGANPMEDVIHFPNNIDIRLLKDYWEPGKEGSEVKRVFASRNNPYFVAHEIKNSFRRDRVFGNVTMEYQILPKLSVMGRMTMDTFFERRETKIPIGYVNEINNGAYGLQNLSTFERNFDFLIKWNDRVGDFSYTISAGGNEMYTKSTGVENSSSNGLGLITPGVFSISNIAPEALSFGSSWSQKAIQSLYAFINLGWKDMVYLDLTARNDWSSTLPKANRSYFYPSASLSLLINQMYDFGRNVTLIKLRGGWAQVGSDTSPYQLLSTYGTHDPWGTAVRMSKSGTMLAPNLKPEVATSKEVGVDLGFIDNRVRFEGTYFVVDNKNQIIQNVPNPVSSGSSASNINMGLVQSRGWEFTVGGTPIKTTDWMWDINVNVTRFRATLKELAPGIERIEFWSDGPVRTWSYVGQEIGDIYANKARRVEDPTSRYHGYYLFSGANAAWEYIPVAEANYKIGNYNADFILGLNSTVMYKNFALSWTLDWRSGGRFYSQTERRIRNHGGSPRSYKYDAINPEGRTGQELRDWLFANSHLFTKEGELRYVGGPTAEMGGFSYAGVSDGCFVPGVFLVKNPDGTESYTEHLGIDPQYGYYIQMDTSWNFAEGSTFPSDFLKLREISLSYQLPKNVLDRIGALKGLAVSVYSRNIMLWTKAKTGIDPERAFTPESSNEGKRGTQLRQGMEQYNVEPWVMPIGVKLNLTF